MANSAQARKRARQAVKARALNMSLSRAAIEGPRPLRLDWPMPNWPAAVLGVNPDDQIVVLTDTGRAARVPVATLSVQGTQLVKVSKAKGERVAAALSVVDGRQQVLVATTDGHARRFPANSLPLAKEAGGGAVVVRRPVAGAAALRRGDQVWLVTNQCIVAVDAHHVPLETAATTKAHPLLKLADGETVTAVFITRGEKVTQGEAGPRLEVAG